MLNRCVAIVSQLAMRITSIESKLLTEIRYLNAGRGPGDFYNDVVPVHRGFVDALPEGTSAIVVTADLQGRESFESAAGHPLRLLGEVLPAMLRADVLPCLGLPKGDIGVLLAGDFYTVPALDKRGGSGDVRRSGTRSPPSSSGLSASHETTTHSPEVRTGRNLLARFISWTTTT